MKILLLIVLSLPAVVSEEGSEGVVRRIAPATIVASGCNSVGEYVRRYKISEPIVVEGFADGLMMPVSPELGAMLKLSSLRQHFCKLFAAKKKTNERIFLYGSRDDIVIMQSEEFFREMERPIFERDAHVYFSRTVEDLIHELGRCSQGFGRNSLAQALAEFDAMPSVVGISSINEKPTAMLWVSQPGTVSSAHYDSSFNIFLQLSGKKRFRLLPPSAARRLRMFPFTSHQARHSQILKMEHDDIMTVDLAANETLVLPPFYIHEVETLEPSVALSVWSFPAHIFSDIGSSLNTRPLYEGFHEDPDAIAMLIRGIVQKFFKGSLAASTEFIHDILLRYSLVEDADLCSNDDFPACSHSLINGQHLAAEIVKRVEAMRSAPVQSLDAEELLLGMDVEYLAHYALDSRTEINDENLSRVCLWLARCVLEPLERRMTRITG
eukprot:g2189.t1